MPCLQQRKTLRRFTSCTRCQASSEVSSTEASSFGLMPALLNSTSMRPNSSRARGVHVADLLLVGDVGLRATARPTASASRSTPTTVAPSACEQPRRLGADPARGAGDHADLARRAVPPSASSVA